MEKDKLVELITQQIAKRQAVVLSQDPQFAYLKGALDAVTEKLQINEDEEEEESPPSE
tara:strand:+ start:253 stop:426 length:174 start_codon:yes stop_codon:yes gene_type:complete